MKTESISNENLVVGMVCSLPKPPSQWVIHWIIAEVSDEGVLLKKIGSPQPAKVVNTYTWEIPFSVMNGIIILVEPAVLNISGYESGGEANGVELLKKSD